MSCAARLPYHVRERSLKGTLFLSLVLLLLRLYACDLLADFNKFLKRYPFFRSTEEERELLFGDSGRTGIPLVRPTARTAQRLAELEAALV